MPLECEGESKVVTAFSVAVDTVAATKRQFQPPQKSALHHCSCSEPLSTVRLGLKTKLSRAVHWYVYRRRSMPSPWPALPPAVSTLHRRSFCFRTADVDSYLKCDLTIVFE